MSYNILQYLTISYSILQYLTISYNILQYLTISYDILQYLTISYNILQYITISNNTLQYLTISYNILQHISQGLTDGHKYWYSVYNIQVPAVSTSNVFSLIGRVSMLSGMIVLEMWTESLKKCRLLTHISTVPASGVWQPWRRLPELSMWRIEMTDVDRQVNWGKYTAIGNWHALS